MWVILLCVGLALAEPESIFVAPTLIQSAVPEYPAEAMADRITGTVIVRLTLDEEGRVVDVMLLQGLREDVDTAAVTASFDLGFSPALRDGAPVTSALDYAFNFALKVDDQQGNAVPGSARMVLRDNDGLPVPGAVVELRSDSGQIRNLLANDDGVARMDFLPPGQWTVSVRAEGFAPTTMDMELKSGETRALELQLVAAGPSEEVVVIGVRQRWREVKRAERKPDPEPVVSAYELTRRDVESTAGALEDVNRAVHKLPGVASDGDLLSGFSVRGFTAGEVVFQLDRVPIDNPYHLAGFNSIFNPDMLQKVQFYSSAAPSAYPDTTSAVMDVQSWDGEPKDDRHDLDGAIDVSMSTARLLLMGPIGKSDDLTFAFAARRSYLELYFGLMKAMNLLDVAVAAPEYDELSLRTAWRPGRHRLLLTLLRTGDHLALVDSDDESKITISGNFELNNVLYLASLDHLYTGANGASIQSTLSYSVDSSKMERDFAGSVNRTTRRSQFFWRSDVDVPFDEHHRLMVGAQTTLRAMSFEGPVDDTRSTPAWTALPLADRGLPQLELSQEGWAPVWATYLEHRYTGPVRTRIGARTTYVTRNGELLFSPSAGLSVPLPTATIPKIAAGLYHHVVEDPLTIDPEYGNPDIESEKAAHVIVGVDQGLPIGDGGLLRVEGYYSKLWDLVVNPDTDEAVAAGDTYENAGTGVNAGIDAMFAARLPRWQFMMNFGWLHARRHNPKNEAFVKDYTPGQAQAVTAGASVEFQITPAWRVSTRYDFHTGRPMSEVEVSGEETVRMTSLNEMRLKPFHQIDLRAEWRKATKWVRWSVYIEVLNVTYFQSPFLPIVTVKDGEREDSQLSHLPTRPFLGVRADF